MTLDMIPKNVMARVTSVAATDAHSLRLMEMGLVPGAPVRVVKASETVPADPTPGMARERAFEVPTLWAGRVVTEPGAVSGWHHHDLNETSIYVVSGVLRLEFEGYDGYVDAEAGDFVHVPPYTVHRESNPTDRPSVAVLARAGGGVPTVNVDAADVRR